MAVVMQGRHSFADSSLIYATDTQGRQYLHQDASISVVSIVNTEMLLFMN